MKTFKLSGNTVTAATGGRPFDSTKPTVIFIHGAGNDHTVWALQTRYFAHHGFSVLAIDLPGHGGSDGTPLKTINEMADWLGEVIAKLDCAPAHLVGHSMGALIALSAAATQPNRVASIALLGAAAAMPVHPDLLEMANTGVPATHDLISSWGLGRPQHLGGHKAPGLWMQRGLTATLERDAFRALGIDFAACDGFPDARGFADTIGCPALVLAGAIDQMARPKMAAELADALPNASLTVIPGSGHIMMVEKPDETLDALIAFYRSQGIG